MKQIEIKEKRKEREKHFLQQNGEIIAQVFDEDIHYLKNGKYEEIDNTLIKDKNSYCNRSNAFRTFFNDSGKNLMTLKSNGNQIKMNLKDCNKIIPEKKEYGSKLYSSIFYKNIIDNIDLRYTLTPTKVKEEIILNDVSSSEKELVFVIQTDLELVMNNDKTISVYDNNENKFTLEAPFMIDSNNKINDNICYELVKLDNNYELKIILDKEWLNNKNTKYPVVIDPTITNNGQNNSVYDTYIYSGDTNVTRYNTDILKVGVEKINGIDRVNRTLLKFDLPQIGTGDQIVNATLNLVGYGIDNGSYTDRKILNVHQVIEDWTESGANWTTMNDKYDFRVESCFYSERSDLSSSNVLTPKVCSCDLTNIVKHWYSDTPNYGIMIKLNNEVYTTSCLPSFYSKNNTVTGGNPKPVLTITYRNQNGLESYMEYETQEFERGNVYENLYNGNLTAVFRIGNTIEGKLPTGLEIVYNTNDVLINKDCGFGLGWNTNFSQTIKEVIIDSETYLEFNDDTATTHYFKNDEGIYYDEDGLNYTILKSNNKYILSDKDGNKLVFAIKSGIGYLEEIIDVSENKISILYDENNFITQIVDANNNVINILYEENEIRIISPYETVSLVYENNKLMGINTTTGITNFTYNESNLISSITDENKLKFSYEYYAQKPYRVKKIIEHGIDNTIGGSYDIIYEFNVTKIIDNNNKANIITFNSYGNVSSVIDLKNDNKIKDAYAKREIYGDYSNVKNKLISDQIAEKYVNNYLHNTSFNNSEIWFQSNDVLISITDETSFSENRCLKMENTDYNQESKYLAIVPSDNFYTFSCYMKNSNDVKIALCYTNIQNEEVIVESRIIKPRSNFERESITIYYPNETQSISNLYIKVISVTPGIIYIDNIQLEEGELANSYNYVENSNFYGGLGSWEQVLSVFFALGESTNMEPFEDGTFELVEVEENVRALKVNMDPRIETTLRQHFDISGNKDDTYSLSFWYKNTGIKPLDSMQNNYAVLDFKYGEEYDENSNILVEQLNSDCQEWQYYSALFTATSDFTQMRLSIHQKFNANEFLITNISIQKDSRKTDYDFDEDGNIISIKNLNNESENYKYDHNNQVIKEITENGDEFVFEYDKRVTDRIINGVSSSGISNRVKYANDNIVSTKTINNEINLNSDEIMCSIRLQGTYRYLKNKNNRIQLLEGRCVNDKWILERNDSYYAIKHSIIKNMYIAVVNGKVVLSDKIEEKSLFSLIKNDNGSYLIKLDDNQSSSSYYLKATDKIEVSILEENNIDFNFFFESDTCKIFIEDNSEYTEDGRFVTKTINANLSQTNYDIDPVTGNLNYVIDSKGVITSNTYDDKKQIIKTECLDRVVEYRYNDKNMIDKIIKGNGSYNLIYDNFLNLKQVKIGDNIIFVTNNYKENNGDLYSIVYGNNDSISYSYDDFDRISSITKMDNVYSNKYGSDGNLLKVVSQNDITEFLYDEAKRIYEYKFNDFRIKYSYDKSDRIINTVYKLDDNEESISNLFNKDEEISKLTIDTDKEINYNYDAIGRINNKNINNLYNINYEYYSNGNRASLLLKNMQCGVDNYSYKYDKMNNITHIYMNNALIYKYYYDAFNQLEKEEDYINNKYIKYAYDKYGNIISKNHYYLNDYNLIYKNSYEYTNVNWKDLLTKFNGEEIVYDTIGNPVAIGESSLEWINGRELKTYINNSKNINANYKYDSEGIRLSKNVNGVETKYYLEDDEIIFEKINTDVLYYIRDEEGYLEGLKFNGSLYYYIKNNRDDVIGIMDNNCNKIASYEYDGYGNLLSIKDSNGNKITDPNHIAIKNPFRYRSYYYDSETGFYYLNDRYYNPEWGRFINADAYCGEIGGKFLLHNLFVYAMNNPIMNTDSSGNWAIFAPIVSTVSSAVVKSVAKKAVKTIAKIAVIALGAASNKGIVNNKPKSGSTCPVPKPKAKSKSSSKSTSASKSRTNSSSKNTSKTNKTTKTKTNKNKNNGKKKEKKPCTTAKLSISGREVIRGTEKLTVKESVKHVSLGGSVMCDNKFYATQVASYFPGAFEEENQIKKPGYSYYRHYHPDRTSHRHIWFLPKIR